MPPPQERLPDVWASRDYPVLLEVTRRIDQGATAVNSQDLVDALDMTELDISLAFGALVRRGLLGGEGGTAERATPLYVCDVSGAAYLLTGLHPDGDDALSALIQALRQAADQTSDEEERSRLRKAADALGSIGRDLGVGIMTALVTRYTTG